MSRIIISKNCCDCLNLTDPCAPCEIICCMYPAPELINGIFTWEDLPDLIIRKLSSGDLTYSKLSPPVEAFDGFVYYQATTSGPIGSGEENVIFIQSGDGENSRWKTVISGAGVDGGTTCLISSNSNFTQDTFDDTYEVSYQESVNAPAVNVTVTRISLCVWRSEIFSIGEGTNRQITMEYSDGSRYPNNNHKWIIQNNFLLWSKQPFQNSPVGTYSNINLPSITVS